MAKDLHKLAVGNVLSQSTREMLIAWLKGNTTGAGVPEGWTVGDKTGTGSLGTTNDIGVIWPNVGVSPIVLAIYFTQNEKDSAPRRRSWQR
jgi:beta-lactamase class A